MSALNIDLGFAKLVAEIDESAGEPAIFICLTDKKDVTIQDVACIRQSRMRKTKEPLPAINVRVLTDKDSDDYTYDLECGVRREYYVVRNLFTDANYLVLATTEADAIQIAKEKLNEASDNNSWEAEFICTELENPLQERSELTYDCDYVLEHDIFSDGEKTFLSEIETISNKKPRHPF